MAISRGHCRVLLRSCFKSTQRRLHCLPSFPPSTTISLILELHAPAPSPSLTFHYSLHSYPPTFLSFLLKKSLTPSLLQMFSNLVSHCFDSCIDDFTTKSLIQRESGCVSRCVKKYMDGAERIGQRFQEQQAQMMQNPPPGR